MKITYKRDLQHSWLILSAEERPAGTYAGRILSENLIPGLLTCHQTRVNEEENWYYDISGLRSLADLLETDGLSRTRLEKWLQNLLGTIETLEDYLLSADGLRLSAEYSFYAPEEDRFFFLYHPQVDRPFLRGLQTLSEEILPHLQRTDAQAVVLGYALYQESHTETEPLTLLRTLLSRKVQPMQEAPAQSRQEQQEAEERSLLLDAFFGAEEEEPTVWEKWKERLCRILHKKQRRPLSTDLLRQRRKDRRERLPKGEEIWENSSEIRQEDLPDETEVFHEEGEDEKTELLLPAEVKTATHQLTALRAGEEPQKIPLTAQRYLIGKRESGANLHLPSRAVSRLHAILCVAEDACSLRDLNSRNGTWVNGTLLLPKQIVTLRAGDHIRFADSEYRFT